MKVAVSACLLGEKCRYDGNSKTDERVLDFVEDKEVIPFCPEDALYGSPREKMQLVNIGSHVEARKLQSHKIVTEEIVGVARTFLAENPNIDTYIVKSKSPSCGLKSTPIYDEQGKVFEEGNAGIFTHTVRRENATVNIYEEGDL